MVSHQLTWLLLGLVATVLQGCSSGPSKPESVSGRPSIGGPATPGGEPPAHATPQEMAAYREIEALCTKNLYESAEAKMNLFPKKHPKSPLLPSIENLHGLMLLRLKKA